MKIINDKVFTKREGSVVLLILYGKNKREIADILFVSISTIKTTVENIYRKFNVHNKAELIIFVIKNKIIDLEDDTRL